MLYFITFICFKELLFINIYVFRFYSSAKRYAKGGVQIYLPSLSLVLSAQTAINVYFLHPQLTIFFCTNLRCLFCFLFTLYSPYSSYSFLS